MDFRTQAIVYARKLHRYVASSNNNYLLGQIGKAQCLVRGDAVLVPRDWHLEGLAARGNQDVVGAQQDLLSGGLGDLDRVSIHQPSRSFEGVYARIVKHPSIQTIEALYFLGLVRDECFPVQRGHFIDRPSESTTIFELGGELGCVHEQFLGHAPADDAGASKASFLCSRDHAERHLHDGYFGTGVCTHPRSSHAPAATSFGHRHARTSVSLFSVHLFHPSVPLRLCFVPTMVFPTSVPSRLLRTSIPAFSLVRFLLLPFSHLPPPITTRSKSTSTMMASLPVSDPINPTMASVVPRGRGPFPSSSFKGDPIGFEPARGPVSKGGANPFRSGRPAVPPSPFGRKGGPLWGER
eukprot:scaffold932_cov328-Pavlova_lutheri.AAC.34